MPRPTDDPERDSTLPLPELNPLLNPLLGQHMGRWAEVYFTSPPEKREEAVLELLRELEGNAPTEIEHSAGEHDRDGQPESSKTAVVDLRPEVEHRPLVCRSCGQRNSSEHRFCGMCGVPLIETEPASEAPSQLSQADKVVSSEPRQDALRFYVGSSTTSGDPYMSNDLREPIRAANDGPQFGHVDDPHTARYRLYIGVTLTLVIGALLYTAWRGTQTWSGSSRPAPQRVPIRTSPPAQPVAQPLTSSPNAANQVATDNSANSTSSNGKVEQVSTASTNKKSESGNNGSASAPTNIQPESAIPPGTSPEAGSEELAVAESYLNGTQGKQRDSSEAAKWLWKAVGKKNAAATLLLSDLYLRGDGVSQSCDQARLLLDAAARKGAPGADTRIRNLQAFGCQ